MGKLNLPQSLLQSSVSHDPYFNMLTRADNFIITFLKHNIKSCSVTKVDSRTSEWTS